MKRIISTTLVLLLMLGMLPVSALKTNAASGVQINSTNFPDTAFRNYVSSNIDTNGDGYLSDSERNVSSIYVNDLGISDLKGIAYFTGLESLSCANNNLIYLDISKNTKLTSLSCEYNDELPGLDISNNPYLIQAYQYGDERSPLGEYVYYYDYDSGYYLAFGVSYQNLFTSSNASKPTITSQPSNKTVSSGKTATFSVQATGVTKYQWYYRTSGTASWTAVSSIEGKKATYSFTTATRHDGYQYRCKVTNPAGSVYTSTRTLKLNAYAKPSVTTQPSNKTVATGDTVKFTVKATGGGLSYQWYYRASGSDSWTAVAADSGKTATYSLKAAGRHNGYQYRCKITNAKGTVYSSAGKLTVVTTKPSITTQPTGKTVKAGKTVTFTVKASGRGLSYQWYYRTSGSGTWTAVSASSGKTASYSLKAAERHNGYQYRCKVTNLLGTVYTNTVTLKVNN